MNHIYVLRVLLVIVLEISIVNIAFAKDGPLTADYWSCVNSKMSNIEWSACGYDEIKRQEDFLDAALTKVSHVFEKWSSIAFPAPSCSACGPDDFLATLMREQAAWTSWKDAACEFWLRGGFGRETDVLTYPICKARFIAERVDYLKGLAKTIQEDYINH